MRRNGIAAYVAAGLILTACSGRVDANNAVPADSLTTEAPTAPQKAEPVDTTTLKANALAKAYPDCIKGYDNGLLKFADGTTMPFDDGKTKSFEQRLDNADAEDMMERYVDYNGEPPAYLSDAGRTRCEQLFKKMYGNTSSEVSKQLTTVDWFGQKLKFSSTNGAADSLRAVAREIAQHPDLIKYAKPSAGTFYWRTVRGAKRLSAHSFGIAIDVCTSRSNYWRWDNPGRGETAKIGYRNAFPHQLAEIFARHGFIWGGNWYHYDTMHFEFRPEYFVEW